MDLPAEPELPPEVARDVDVTELQKLLLDTMRDTKTPRHLRVQIANRLLTASGRLGANVKGVDPGESDPELLVRQIAEHHNNPLLDRWFRPKKPRVKVDDPNRIYTFSHTGAESPK